MTVSRLLLVVPDLLLPREPLVAAALMLHVRRAAGFTGTNGLLWSAPTPCAQTRRCTTVCMFSGMMIDLGNVGDQEATGQLGGRE